MTTQTAAELRASAARHDQDAADSFDRCDTDGFLSQWASGLCAQRDRLQATIVENGGTSEFLALFDLDGNWVPARQIDGQWGTRWMVLDAAGKATGTFLPVAPVRRSTLAKKGFVEGYVRRPAKADFVGRNACSVSACSVPTDRPWDPPLAIVTPDRWAD